MTKDYKKAKLILTLLFFAYCGLILIDFVTTGISSMYYSQGAPIAYMTAIILKLLGDIVSKASFCGILGCLVFSLDKKKNKLLLLIFGAINVFYLCIGNFLVTIITQILCSDITYYIDFISEIVSYIKEFPAIDFLSITAILVVCLFFEKYEYILMCSLGGISLIRTIKCLGSFIITEAKAALQGTALITIFEDFIGAALIILTFLAVTAIYGMMAYILIIKRRNKRFEKMILESTDETKSLGEDNAEV